MQLGSYSYKGQNFVANNVPPWVPDDLPIDAVIGLDNYRPFSLASLTGPSKAQTSVGPQSGTEGVLTPQDLWGVYDDPGAAALTNASGASSAAALESTKVDVGQGQSIEIFGEGETSSVVAQLRLFEQAMGFPKVPVRVVHTEGGGDSGYGDNTGAVEWYLDSQAATGMAPDVSQLNYYFAKSLFDADIFEGCPQLVAPVAGAGNGVAPQPVPMVNFPCDSEYAVCVGGTVVSVNGSSYPQSAQRAAETTWTESGGGSSYFLTAPGFQTAVANANHPCLSTHTTPCTSGSYARDFFDVTQSEYGAGNGAYQPGPGWDYTSGWGALNVANFTQDVDGTTNATDGYTGTEKPAAVVSTASSTSPTGNATDPVDVSLGDEPSLDLTGATLQASASNGVTATLSGPGIGALPPADATNGSSFFVTWLDGATVYYARANESPTGSWTFTSGNTGTYGQSSTYGYNDTASSAATGSVNSDTGTITIHIPASEVGSPTAPQCRSGRP